jgi:hypothetical protein
MFEEPRDIITQHPINYEAVMHRPAPASREATPSNDKEAPFDDAAHCAQDCVRGGNKGHKQHHLGTMTTLSHDDDRGWEVGSSGMGRVSTATHGSSPLTRTHSDRCLYHWDRNKVASKNPRSR